MKKVFATLLTAFALVLAVNVTANAEVVFELPLIMNSIEGPNTMGWGTDGSPSITHEIGLTVEHFAQGRYLVLETHYEIPNWDNGFHYAQLMLNGESPQGGRSWEFGSDISLENDIDPRVALITENMVVFDLNPLKAGAGHDDMEFTGWEHVQLHIAQWSLEVPQIGLTRAYLSSEVPDAPSTEMFEIVFELPVEMNSVESPNTMGWGTDGSGSNTHDIGLSIEHFAQGRFFVLEVPYEIPNWDNGFHYIQLMLNGESPQGSRSWEFGSDISLENDIDPRIARIYGNMVVFDLNPLKAGAAHDDMYFTGWEDVQLHMAQWSLEIPNIGISRAFLATGVPGQPSTLIVAQEPEEEPQEEPEDEPEEEPPATQTTPEPPPPPPPAPVTPPTETNDGSNNTVVIIIVIVAVLAVGCIAFLVMRKNKKQ